MGASPNWLDKYAQTPADATSVATPAPYAPAIGAQQPTGTLPAPQPTTLADHLKAALNPIGWGQHAHNDVLRALSLFTSADPLDKVKGGLLGAAAVLPMVPGEGELSPLLRAAPEAEAAGGLLLTANEQAQLAQIRQAMAENREPFRLALSGRDRQTAVRLATQSQGLRNQYDNIIQSVRDRAGKP